MAKRLPAAAVFVQAGPRTAGLAGQQRGRSAALGPTAARAGPEPAQPVAAGHCTLGTGRRRSSCLARSRAGARDGAAQGHSPGAAVWEQGRTQEGAVVAGDEGEDRVMVFLAGEEEERLGKRRTGTDTRKG